VPRLEVLENRTVPSGYQQINLVGELPGVAPHTDPNLDGWGMDTTPKGFVVADAPLGVATFYDASGTVLPLVVTVPAAPRQPPGSVGHPRGVVYNPTSEFVISEDGRSAPALVLFGSKDGTISGWNPAVDPDHAIIVVDNSRAGAPGAKYSGLHIDQNSRGQNVLYAADRVDNKVDMFDGSFHFLGSFTDPNVSAQFPGHPGAWQVEEAGDGRLFVLFTMELGPSGPFGGVVDIFDTDGHLLTPNHFAANAPGAGVLESPWGIVQAPADFGAFSNDILIGNDEGPGYINAFDPATGAYLGHLTHPDGTPIAIPGLWYLTFGGGTPETGLTKQLYFDAGPTLERNVGQGLFGRIIAAGRGDGRGSSAEGAADVAGLVSTMQGPGPAPMPLLLIESLSQSTRPQGISVDSHTSSSQPAASNVSNSVTAMQTAPTLASAGEPILQTGNSETVTDALDGLFVGLAIGQDDVPGEFRM
jgi:uncharacterized protein (TIGR03118 family)